MALLIAGRREGAGRKSSLGPTQVPESPGKRKPGPVLGLILNTGDFTSGETALLLG